MRDQVYPNWELCLADDASTITGLRDCLFQHLAEDQRIRVVLEKKRGHISAASNSALALAKETLLPYSTMMTLCIPWHILCCPLHQPAS